jgi:hypothetical protein
MAVVRANIRTGGPLLALWIGSRAKTLLCTESDQVGKGCAVTGRDLFADAQDLSRELASEGETNAARRIESVIEGGSTSSEILVGLRAELTHLLAVDHGSVADRVRVLEPRDAVDAAL